MNRIDAEKLKELQREDDEVDTKSKSGGEGLGVQTEQLPLPTPAAPFIDSGGQMDGTAQDTVSPNKLISTYSDFRKKQSRRSAILGGDFWTTLSSEVGGIRQLLEHNADEDELEEDETPPIGDGSSDIHSSMPTFVFGSAGSPSDMESGFIPSIEERNVLFEFFFRNVHPVCKVLHAPTAKQYLAAEESLPDRTSGELIFPTMRAVKVATGLMAVVSMTPEQCITRLGQERRALLTRYKRATEMALAQADMMNRTDILTLQALVLYIVRPLKKYTSSTSHDTGIRFDLLFDGCMYTFKRASF